MQFGIIPCYLKGNIFFSRKLLRVVLNGDNGWLADAGYLFVPALSNSHFLFLLMYLVTDCDLRQCHQGHQQRKGDPSQDINIRVCAVYNTVQFKKNCSLLKKRKMTYQKCYQCSTGRQQSYLQSIEGTRYRPKEWEAYWARRGIAPANPRWCCPRCLGDICMRSSTILSHIEAATSVDSSLHNWE